MVCLFIVFCFLIGCNKSSQTNQSLEIKTVVEQVQFTNEKPEDDIVPDTTINGCLKLEDYSSTKLFYPDYENISLIEEVREHLIVIFSNKNKTQYLLAFQYEGDTKDSYSCFEIGLWNNEKFEDMKFFITDEKEFVTESGVRLGMTLDDLISKKGQDYIITTEADTLLRYRIDNMEISPFLKRYSMPGYFMEYKIKLNKVQRIQFGFDYP
jgi:hypothetical protein